MIFLMLIIQLLFGLKEFIKILLYKIKKLYLLKIYSMKKKEVLIKGKSSYKRLTAKEQVEQIESKKIIKSLSSYLMRQLELIPN